MSVLEGFNICKTFKEGRESVEVLNDCSLSVDAGDVVALEGPSGSGKSTLLSILGCILTPSSGRVVVDGQHAKAEQLVQLRARAIGFVFQQFNLFPCLTALENVQLALEVRGHRGNLVRSRAAQALDDVGLSERKNFLPRELSGGQKQRVAIARALASSPKIILADEPTANVDSRIGHHILDLFRDLAKSCKVGLLIVTHDPKVRTITDRVISIGDGRIVQ